MKKFDENQKNYLIESLEDFIEYMKGTITDGNIVRGPAKHVDNLFVFEPGSYTNIIKDNTFKGPVYFTPQSGEEKQSPDFNDDEKIKENILKLMKVNSKNNKRWWFCVYRVLKDHHHENVVDLNGFKCYLERLFPEGLPLPIDIHDISKELELDCFAKPYAEWTAEKSPVSSNAYEAYRKVIDTFTGYFE